MWSALILCILLSVVHRGTTQGQNGCPEAEDIKPCVCTQAPFTYLLCQGVDDAEILREVFKKSERYSYNEVHIEYSTLQYLPHDIFEAVTVKQLYLKNVTLAQLFDQPPDALDQLRTLFIEQTKTLRGIFWEVLAPLKGLRILSVYYNPIRTLGEDFSEHATKDLEQLTFYGTETRTIKPHTFANFTNLRKVAIDAGKITTLTRDIFPIPFNVQYLYFNDQKLTEIPSDLFTQMPRLQTLSLRLNQISIIPESAFEGSNPASITYFRFDDNPIKCDCLIEWLLKDKPAVLGGKCESPKKFNGKELQGLSAKELDCKHSAWN